MSKNTSNPIRRIVARMIARLSTFGPVSPGASIPADAKPIPESEDDAVLDTSKPTDRAGGGDDEDDTAEGGEPKGSQGSGADEDDESDDGDTSARPSDGDDTDPGATEADDGVLKAQASAVRAAVDALLSTPDDTPSGKLSVKFTPNITKEMIAEYEAEVEKGNTALALSKLMGAALSEAMELYDEKRVLPVEQTLAEAKRNAENDKKVAAWAAANKEDAANPDLWAKMVEIYNGFVSTKGARRADRVTMDQLAIMAKAELPAASRGKRAKAPTPEAQKKAALGAARTPGAIGVTKPKAAAPAKGKVGHDGEGYRAHLKQTSRDLW